MIQIWIKDPNIELDRKYRGFLVLATEKVFVFPDNMFVKFINNSLNYDYCKVLCVREYHFIVKFLLCVKYHLYYQP